MESVRIRNHVRAVIDEDGAVLLDLRKGRYFSISGVGTDIWRGLMSRRPIAAIREDLLRAYDVAPSRVDGDIRAFLQQLQHSELIDVAG